MDMDSILSLISNGLFPCAMCLLLFWYIKDEQKNTREVIEKLTITIQELKDLISIDVKRGDDYGTL